MPGFVSEERLVFGPWQAIERMLARLIQHAGFTDVSIVGGAGDHGADVVGSFKGERWVLQSKFRSNGGHDSSAAEEVVRALATYRANVGVAAVNSNFVQNVYYYAERKKLDGIDLRLWNAAALHAFFDRLPLNSLCMREARSYQKEAVHAVEEKRGIGGKEALVVMATGLGKTMVANQLIVNELDRNPSQEVLVLAHTSDLVRQLEQSVWPQLRKTISTHLWTDGERPSYSGGVVFATWQSVYEGVKRGEPLEGRFGLVVVDEAHHAPSSSYRKLLVDLSPNFLVGLTATPWRGDEQTLDSLFGSPVFTMDVVEGMQRGFLAEVDYRMLTDGIDWDDVARQSRNGLTIKELNTYLLMPDRDNAMVQVVADKMRALAEPRVLLFCRSIDHAERLRPLLSSLGIRAALLHSGLSREERFRNLTSFRNGEIQLLLSIEMLNEGIDVPDVNLVGFLRVTHSRRIFVQQLGRGLRISPRKKKVVVLDFVADVRRVAAGLAMNRKAEKRKLEREVLRFQDGKIVHFDNDKSAAFFDEYLEDVADIENYEDGSRLRFPDTYQD